MRLLIERWRASTKVIVRSSGETAEAVVEDLIFADVQRVVITPAVGVDEEIRAVPQHRRSAEASAAGAPVAARWNAIAVLGGGTVIKS